MMGNKQDKKLALLSLMEQVVAQDENLRKQLGIGEKFRFIRDRLQNLLKTVREDLERMQLKEESIVKILSEDEVYVYVHLFNAQGSLFSTWQKMLSASVFYEYSVNRPIYGDKTHIEAVIRSKTNRSQHAYLTIILNKPDILSNVDKLTDALGHPLLKIREGSLKLNRLVCFTFNDTDYILNASSGLVKKEAS